MFIYNIILLNIITIFEFNKQLFGLSKNKYPAVAIIGDENDDADEMRKWYRQNFEI